MQAEDVLRERIRQRRMACMAVEAAERSAVDAAAHARRGLEALARLLREARAGRDEPRARA